MRLAFVQFSPAFGEVSENIKQALTLADGVEAELFVFPELFSTGYQFLSRDELRGLAEPVIDGPTVGRLTEWCRQRGAFACAGMAEADGETLYNSAVLVGPGGLRGVYRKTHLFWREKDLFDAAGEDGFEVYDLGPARVGMMVCFDWIFPEVTRILALRGAQIILHPANLVLPHCPAAMVTRCIENRVFAVTANRVGKESRWGKSMKFIGQSQIVNPRGEVLLRLDDEEAAVSIDVNPAEADDKFVTPKNDVMADRHVEFYSELLRPK